MTAVNQELAITHPAGSWTSGALESAAAHDQRGQAVRVRVLRAANNGLGGSTFGETSVLLRADATHYAEFFIASGRLTAWVNSGSGAVNLTPSWPAYSSTTMQWLRFRETGGTLYWEYASGTTEPGTWTVLASRANPFTLSAVRLRIVAGANLATSDTARFDSIATTAA